LIQEVTRILLAAPSFVLSADDIPNVSGFSVEENIRYVLKRYSPDASESMVSRGLQMQSDLMKDLIARLAAGDQAVAALFEPAPRLGDLLRWLRENGIKIALVSSAPEVKVLAEIRCIFSKLSMGDPVAFYDAIVTTGTPAVKGRVGTMGDACAKPHPWLYMEALKQLDVAAGDAIGVEDSGAGLLALAAAGVPSVGVGFSSPRPGSPETLCRRSFMELSGLAEFLMSPVCDRLRRPSEGI
jgi:beta-phosphoglucomutase-like phosphatase (HAD superfamily)